jgi:multidrug efflux pump subunit AcrB
VKLSIEKQPAANTTDVIDAVRARLAELRADGTIPGNVTVDAVNDQSVYIRDAVSGVSSSALLGGGLAILAIAFFLASWRQTVVILVTMPLVVLITFLLMRASGITLNLFSLGGLALGIGQAVDSAIVVLENVTRKQREAASAASAAADGGDAEGAPAPTAPTARATRAARARASARRTRRCRRSRRRWSPAPGPTSPRCSPSCSCRGSRRSSSAS